MFQCLLGIVLAFYCFFIANQAQCSSLRQTEHVFLIPLILKRTVYTVNLSFPVSASFEQATRRLYTPSDMFAVCQKAWETHVIRQHVVKHQVWMTIKSSLTLFLHLTITVLTPRLCLSKKTDILWCFSIFCVFICVTFFYHSAIMFLIISTTSSYLSQS